MVDLRSVGCLPNQHQKVHGEQETKQSTKGHKREYPSSIEECTRQQHSELIVEQMEIGSPSEQHKKCLDE